MKKKYLATIFASILLAAGCGLADKSAAGTNANSDPAPTPAPKSSPATQTPAAGGDNADLGRNLLAFGAGTNVVSFTSESQNSSNGAIKLIDESGYGEGWKTEDGKPTNQSITFEFQARTTLDKIVFDTQFLGSNKNAPKNIRVEVSDAAASGFQTILETSLKEDPENAEGAEQGLDNQVFVVSKKIAGKFLRLTIVSNFGFDENTFIKEMRGYGEQEPLPTQANISGTYQSEGGAIIHLKQDGAAVIGCNEQNENVYEGRIEGRVVTFRATREGKPEGFGFFNFAPDGKKANYAAYPYGKDAFAFYNVANKKSDKVGNCTFLPGLDGAGKDAVKDSMAKSLGASGRAVLYGINFDFNSDVLKPESKPTLDKVSALLKETPDSKFSIEGHTDNVGGEAFNKTLSEKRAASVKKYLTDAGIDAARLTSVGYGLSKPIAENNTEAGRAQNRRVEMAKQ